ncbi:MAG: PHP-associated domain-containing protein [Thermoproteota archaeon]
MPKLKIDLHIHTDLSDSKSGLEEMVEAALLKGLDGVAITDHGTCQAAAVVVRKYSNRLIIVPGLEYTTREGHLLGLGLLKAPPSGLTSFEFSEYVHSRNCLLVIPHPCVPFLGVREKVLRSLNPDAIETLNAAVPFFWWAKRRSEELAEKLGLPQTGGSDAHDGSRVGDAYTIIDSDSSELCEILKAIKEGRTEPFGKALPILYRTRLSLSFLTSW